MPDLRTAPASADSDASALNEMSAALLGQADAVIHIWDSRLRTDDVIATAPGMPDRVLEDHAALFVTDTALALRLVAGGGLESEFLLRDGSAILDAIAERHGAQRARLDWTEAAVCREFALLGEIMIAVVARFARPDAGEALAGARNVIGQMMHQATQVSLVAHRGVRTANHG